MSVRVGKAIVEKPLFAPMAHTPCLYFCHSEEAELIGLNPQKPRKFDWVELERVEKSLELFQLQHESGTLTVQTHGAKFVAPIVFEQKHAVPKERLKLFPGIERYTGYCRSIVRAIALDQPIQFDGYFREPNSIALVTKSQGMQLSQFVAPKNNNLFDWLMSVKPNGLLPE